MDSNKPARVHVDDPLRERIKVEELPALDSSYRVIRLLGSGRNDSGYLVQKEDGSFAVALTPFGRLELNWRKTRSKATKIAELDALGISDHLVHPLAEGSMHLLGPDKPAKPVVIYEYAGESLEQLDSDQDRLEGIKQIKKVLDVLHTKGYMVVDFKPEHWLAVKEGAQLRVRLIDPSQIKKVPTDTSGSFIKGGDHRNLDLSAFVPEIVALFPWVNENRYRHSGRYEGYQKQVEDMIQQIEEGIDTDSPMTRWRKKILFGIRRLR